MWRTYDLEAVYSLGPAYPHFYRSRRHLTTPLSRRKRLVGLDLGTSKVAVVIAEADEYGQLNVTGVGEASAEGLRKVSSSTSTRRCRPSSRRPSWPSAWRACGPSR